MPQNIPGITILGLGPASADYLTRQAFDWLQRISEVYVRTRKHPVVDGLPKSLVVHSFDHLYEQSEDFSEVYEMIIQNILDLGKRSQGVTYAVPGHPFVAEATCPEIIKRAKKLNIPVHVIEGMSFLEPVLTALGIDPFPQITLIDALDLANANHPAFPPGIPALIAQLYSRQVASEVKMTLMEVFPDDHPVILVHGAGTENQIVEDLPLYEIDRSRHIDILSTIYIPPLSPDTSFESFQETIAHLRAPHGCPWDREQTHQTLRTNLLEETYEVLAALDAEAPDSLKEELGDLLLQIVLHAQIAFEDGEFTMEDVIQAINRKLIHRHPHVFGDLKVEGVKGVLKNWEKLKEAERKTNGQESSRGLLDGVPKILPALNQAQEYQSRAARVGFDWDDIQGVWDKMYEELDEIKNAKNDAERASELGDLLFAVVNLVRWLKVDAESALRQTNLKFFKRFRYIELQAQQQGLDLGKMTLKEMDVLWEEAKKQE